MTGSPSKVKAKRTESGKRTRCRCITYVGGEIDSFDRCLRYTTRGTGVCSICRQPGVRDPGRCGPKRRLAKQ